MEADDHGPREPEMLAHELDRKPFRSRCGRGRPNSIESQSLEVRGCVTIHDVVIAAKSVGSATRSSGVSGKPAAVGVVLLGHEEAPSWVRIDIARDPRPRETPDNGGASRITPRVSDCSCATLGTSA
jgi:hypothetical protein